LKRVRSALQSPFSICVASVDGGLASSRAQKMRAHRYRPLDIEVRCGLHTGEIESGEKDVQGIAVHIAARIAALAAASEILVSRTVKDLVAGSGLRGKHSLKGLQEAMELYAASS
jgi:class 3 adenylate cyclase